MQFKGTKNYIATEDLSLAVNAAAALERPLLIKGEPGTGKTLLAIEVAQAMGLELIEWHIKSTTKASQGLYEYDAVTRLRDSQLGDERVKDISNYINFPDRETMNKIVSVHYPKIKKKLVNEALEIFFDLRKIPGLKKKPSTSELIDWLKLLLSDDMPDEILKNADSSKAIPPLYGALLKNEQDVQLLERLAFMSRRESASTK